MLPSQEGDPAATTGDVLEVLNCPLNAEGEGAAQQGSRAGCASRGEARPCPEELSALREPGKLFSELRAPRRN